MQNVSAHIFRLMPGEDLKKQVEQFVMDKQIKAGWISSCVGSLINFAIRFANQPAATIGHGFFEVLSVTGTVSINGCHLHICISDGNGSTSGGHLTAGNIIYTIAEIVILSTDAVVFTREQDKNTGWWELCVKSA